MVKNWKNLFPIFLWTDIPDPKEDADDDDDKDDDKKDDEDADKPGNDFLEFTIQLKYQLCWSLTSWEILRWLLKLWNKHDRNTTTKINPLSLYSNTWKSFIQIIFFIFVVVGDKGTDEEPDDKDDDKEEDEPEDKIEVKPGLYNHLTFFS